MAEYNNLNSKVTKLHIPDTSTLMHINRYNADKEGLEKEIQAFKKKYQILVSYLKKN